MASSRLAAESPIASHSTSTTGSPALPASSSTLELHAHPQDGETGLKWYKKPARPLSLGGHPYACEAISLAGAKDPNLKYEDVQFWPFVGALEPPGALDASWDWKDYEGTIAMCGGRKVVVAKCDAADPWKVLYELEVKDDLFYSLAWSYHPVTFHPLIVVGGSGSVITIFDLFTKSILRVLKGHGGGILNIAVHPSHTHIVASTSYDKTVRIWSILGADGPDLVGAGMRRGENYPQGDADEGTAIFAILCGEGQGGHRSYVTGVSFHPTKHAIATCGIDRQVKIWPLPAMPEVQYPLRPTPIGYRPRLVRFPLFSTSKMNGDYTDWIDWLSEDTLATRGRGELTVWRWIGYQRYFRPGLSLPLSTNPPMSDYRDSGSFTVLSKYRLGPDAWACTASLHRPFRPQTAAEKAKMSQNDNLCTDPLIALASHSSSTVPEMVLVNPFLAEDPEPPEPLQERRGKPNDDDGDYGVDPDASADSIGASQPKAAGSGAGSGAGAEVKVRADGVMAASAQPQCHPSLEPWRLAATDWSAVFRSRGKKKLQIRSVYDLSNVAISPRGAEWVVGVGEAQRVFVWRMAGGEPNALKEMQDRPGIV